MYSDLKSVATIPTSTAHAARRLYGPDHVYLRIGDHLQEILERVYIALLDPGQNQSAENALRLAMVVAFQYAEALPDPAASECTMRRLDWKYALFLPINFPGIFPATLCAYRKSLLAFPESTTEFAVLLNCLGRLGLFKNSPLTTQEPRQVLVAVCNRTRLDLLNQAMSGILSTLVSSDPEWLKGHMLPHWYERYQSSKGSQNGQARMVNAGEEASRLGSDIYRLLVLLRGKDHLAPAEQAEIRNLTRLFAEQYTCQPAGIQWRPGCENCELNQRDSLYL